ncbi:MAG: hypothetical protein IJU76_16065 [Desulfovibrionaceae bacterium]|nr:hypothetical protein [Desulfovibrionaceae bacterium]
MTLCASYFFAIPKFDEALYYQFSDILSDILYKWYQKKYKSENTYVYDLFNEGYKQKLFRNSTIKFLEIYNTILKSDTAREFGTFSEKAMDEKAREFWLGYSLNFSQGIMGTSKFRLIFVTDRGEEIATDPLLYMDYQVFGDNSIFERTIQNLFKGIFQPTVFPSSDKKSGFDIFREK